MRFFVVTINDGGAEGEYQSLEQIYADFKYDQNVMTHNISRQLATLADHTVMVIRDLNATQELQKARIGDIVHTRRGWIFVCN